MNGGRRHERSGLIRRAKREPGKPLDTPAAIKGYFRRLSENRSLDASLKRSRDYLAELERVAFAIYARHGLPDRDGSYWRIGAEGPWRPFSVADEPGGPWRPVEGQEPPDLIVGLHCAHAEKLGDIDFPADSEVGFAVVMLKAVRVARSRLDDAERADDVSAVHCFEAGADLVEAYGLWHEEFARADLIAPTLKSRAGSQVGAAKRRELSEPVLNAARDYIAANPRTSQGACARHIAQTLKRDQSAVTRKISGLFEWVDLSGGGREKRPKTTQ